MIIINSYKVLLFGFLLLAAIAGCSPHVAAPIDSRAAPPSTRITHHIVSEGETLYAIAWRYELDYHKLARANGIAAPYTIREGQRLTLDLSKAAKPVRVAAAKPVSKPVSKPKVASTSKPVRSTTKPRTQTNSKTSSKASTKSKTAKLPSSWRWQWPAKGRVQRYYDASKTFKGINIFAGKGRPVKAAAPGVVVYAGSGLRGYGRLIILRHSDVFLSAYAQNRRILVKEGDVVSVGQKIAEVGGDSEKPDRLYFEIRRDGKSVDPLRLLPKQ